jgi:hypothetical protein
MTTAVSPMSTRVASPIWPAIDSRSSGIVSGV